jgi:hypothetical protein
MSTVKTTFTLHENYKDFTLSKLEEKTLVPYSLQFTSERLLIQLIGMVFPLIFLFYSFINGLVFPVLLDRFGQQSTAQVTECRMQQTKTGEVPHLYYTYFWKEQTFTGSQYIYGTSDRWAFCAQYASKTIPIRVLVLDPNHSSLLIEGAVPSLTDNLGQIAMLVFFGGLIFAIFYNILYSVVIQIRARSAYPRLLRQGIVLEGEIVTIRGWTHSKTRAYIVSIVYSVESPRKKYLTGRAQARRDDLKGAELPSIGSPVAVLYADDHAHMML